MADNPLAFPTQIDGLNVHGDPGMSLRDWFAGRALGLVTPEDASAIAQKSGRKTPDVLAGLAYELADAMLKYRAKGGDQ